MDAAHSLSLYSKAAGKGVSTVARLAPSPQHFTSHLLGLFLATVLMNLLSFCLYHLISVASDWVSSFLEMHSWLLCDFYLASLSASD